MAGLSGPLGQLLATLPQTGRVDWIGLRPAPRAPMQEVDAVLAEAGRGLAGDRWAGRPDGARQLTLLQAEHLPVIAGCAGLAAIEPARLRRNLVISGLNLLALKGRRFRLGEALCEYSGLCQPCSRMEAALGPGGWNAMRGHGGITARVLESGWVRIGDALAVESLP